MRTFSIITVHLLVWIFTCLVITHGMNNTTCARSIQIVLKIIFAWLLVLMTDFFFLKPFCWYENYFFNNCHTSKSHNEIYRICAKWQVKSVLGFYGTQGFISVFTRGPIVIQVNSMYSPSYTYFCSVSFNIILSYMCRPSKWTFHFATVRH
jgi:hypothetical protein